MKKRTKMLETLTTGSAERRRSAAVQNARRRNN